MHVNHNDLVLDRNRCWFWLSSVEKAGASTTEQLRAMTGYGLAHCIRRVGLDQCSSTTRVSNVFDAYRYSADLVRHHQFIRLSHSFVPSVDHLLHCEWMYDFGAIESNQVSIDTTGVT